MGVCCCVRERQLNVLSACQNCLSPNFALIQNVLGGVFRSTARKHKPSLERGLVTVGTES